MRDLAARAAKLDANDYLYTFESSADYDPASKLGAITKPLLPINFADDLINPLDLLEVPNTPSFTKIVLPGGYGHQTLVHPDLWAAPALGQFLEAVPARS